LKDEIILIKNQITAADYIALFIEKHCFETVFLVTGGACAFIVDAIGENSNLEYTCFQHEQSAAMAADAIWRTCGKIGVTVSTSGPGATNLITGIACSYFDSIPAIHITGQVNQNESKDFINAEVRQAGFQETDIVSIVNPITKWAHKVKDSADLIESLDKAIRISLSGRKGPVLLDVPMNVQKELIDFVYAKKLLNKHQQLEAVNTKRISKDLLSDFLKNSERPIFLLGAGAGLSGTIPIIQSWCEDNSIPFATSWGALTFVDRSSKFYLGSIGVYGSRFANWAIQAADRIVVLGSRLDNRQRTANSNGFAPFSKIIVLDVDDQELKKFSKQQNYTTAVFDLGDVAELLNFVHETQNYDWLNKLESIKQGNNEGMEVSVPAGNLNPYYGVRALQKKFTEGSIVVTDCGANLCWVMQSYLPDSNYVFSAFGNSPMGYSLPAAIGAQLANPGKEVYCFIGDGGLQMNIQELQTIDYYQLPIKIIVQNNFGYGIIKQFQDSYFDSRYHATGKGYSIPNFEKIAEAYNFEYTVIKEINDIEKLSFTNNKMIIDMHIFTGALITPKTEMNRFIHDQFPYTNSNVIEQLPYQYPKTPSQL
jgi:acetolactate synthase-1/2/3 large subunit